MEIKCIMMRVQHIKKKIKKKTRRKKIQLKHTAARNHKTRSYWYKKENSNNKNRWERQRWRTEISNAVVVIAGLPIHCNVYVHRILAAPSSSTFLFITWRSRCRSYHILYIGIACVRRALKPRVTSLFRPIRKDSRIQ